MASLLSRWVVSFGGTAFLAGLLWVFGPLWPPLEPLLPRVVAVQALVVVWAIANAVLDWRRRGRAVALDAGLASGEEAEEGAALRGALAAALARLRREKGRGILAELPFYAIIGPPGAGKTTALLNAGLRFLFPGDEGRAAVAGVGGTRFCEWWFTESAVLIDTAGRYTTQDSDAAVDRAGWDAFLSLLKRTRPRQPLNGVLVAIALPELLGADPAGRNDHAASIARRIAELEGRFSLRLPVYVLFTKADLVAGFTEFFDNLDTEARDQVWGETFALDSPSRTAEGFAAAFRSLATGLSKRMLARLAAERRPDRRAAIAGFPTQFAALEKPLAAFLEQATGRATLLRGAYFTSGTQDGTPIDRLTGAMARSFGIVVSRPAASRPEAGRSYFLGRLLREVIFGEAMLVREPPARRRRRTLVRGGILATLLLLLAGAVAAMVWSAGEGDDQVAATGTALAAYEAVAAPVATELVTNGDLQAVAAVLDRARGLADAVPKGTPGFGFGQDDKLRAGSAATYRQALGNGLLPRLLWRLEAAMRGDLGNPDRLYEETRVYLMLGGAGPLDPAPVRAWLAQDWTRTWPGETEMVTDLLGHLDRLLAEPLPAVELDVPLLAAARAAIGRVPLAARVYASLQGSAAATALPAWQPFRSLGLAGATVFTRASGKPMTEGIPGLFTAEGYRKVLQSGLPAIARRVARESWVEGRTADWSAADLQSLEQGVMALYANDFVARWDAMLTDLNVAPMATLPGAAQSLYILSSGESPLRALLRSVTAQLTEPETVAARFRPLTVLTTGDGAALERVLRLIADIQQPLAKIAALPVGTAPPAGGEDIGNALLGEAARQPPPVNRWLTAIAAGAQALRTGNARRRIALLFNAPGGPATLCAAALARPPFAPGGTPLSFEEFARVFSPGGALNGFLNTELKPYVDMSGKPWKAGGSGTGPAPLGPADITLFQHADAIREAFFPAGQIFPSFQVEVTPMGTRSARLVAGGVVIEAGKNPVHTTQLTWPPAAPGGALEASIVAEPALSLRETGPWALNNLVSRGRLTPSPRPGRQILSFEAPPGIASFDLTVSGNASPFAPGLLSGFRCPAVQ